MAEEGLQVVKQWLEASSQLEEGKGGPPGEAWDWGGVARLLTALLSPCWQPPSIAAGRWRKIGACQCSAPTRQSMGLTSPGVWVRRAWMAMGTQMDVGRQPRDECSGVWLVSESLLSAGEDMSADGRRQLALFLVS